MGETGKMAAGGIPGRWGPRAQLRPRRFNAPDGARRAPCAAALLQDMVEVRALYLPRELFCTDFLVCVMGVGMLTMGSPFVRRFF